MKHITRSKKQKGFTLIEALVAILVFTSALIIFGTILSRGLSSVTNARSELQAYLFAQEGIEAAHQLRDSFRNVGLGWTTWVDGATQQCSQSVGCQVILAPDLSLSQCPSGGCVKIKDTGTYYDQSGVGEIETLFTRTVTIKQPLSVSTEATITSTVEWIDATGHARTTTLSAIIQQW